MKNEQMGARIAASCCVVMIGLGAARADGIEPTLISVSPLVAAVDAGIPYDVRSDERGIFVVSRKANDADTFVLVDLDAKTQKTVKVHPPAGLSSFQLFCVDRLAPHRFVASAGWGERGFTRNGLVFFGDDGVVTKYVGYGFTIRSISVDENHSLIAASIQSPRPAEATDPNTPALFGLAVFDSSGKLLTQIGAARNRYQTFDEMKQAIRSRRPFFVNGNLMLSVPNRTSRDPYSVVETTQLSRVPLGSALAASAAEGREIAPMNVWLQLPAVEGVGSEQLRLLNVVPTRLQGKTAFLAAWNVGQALSDRTQPVIRNGGRVILAVYGADEGQAVPMRWGFVPTGTHLAEMTVSPNGRALGVLFNDIAKGWWISALGFEE